MTKDTIPLQMNWKRIEDLDHDERRRIEEMCNGDERERNMKMITSSKVDHVFNALNELDTRMKEAGADWETWEKAEAEAS
jgi:hypothetical protein